ncbi:hypothetical protein LTR85_006271 [Meristemomyces frigidus]|nr:hypothetical protein LTR85_006271 [Meristemomyces frigidus]
MDADGIDVMYEYDLGDGWEHKIEFLGIADKGLDGEMRQFGVKEGQHSFCLDGDGHPCAEDCGGPMGWERTKTRQIANGVLDPYHWDMIWVNRRLDHMWLEMTANNVRRYWKEIDEEDVWRARVTAGKMASEERKSQLNPGQDEEDQDEE